jgi:hypothetical protein
VANPITCAILREHGAVPAVWSKVEFCRAVCQLSPASIGLKCYRTTVEALSRFSSVVVPTFQGSDQTES